MFYKDTLNLAKDILKMHMEIEELREEVEELREYKKKFQDLLNSSIKHNEHMMINLVKATLKYAEPKNEQI